ncbi:hypothetical protein D3C84_873690 [compost metagenome]
MFCSSVMRVSQNPAVAVSSPIENRMAAPHRMMKTVSGMDSQPIWPSRISEDRLSANMPTPWMTSPNRMDTLRDMRASSTGSGRSSSESSSPLTR